MGFGRGLRIGDEARGAATAGTGLRAQPSLIVPAAAIGLVLLTGCQGGPSSGRLGPSCSPAATGAVIAQQWFAARADAQRQGTENLVAFHAADVVMDHRALGPSISTDREEALRTINRVWEARAATTETLAMSELGWRSHLPGDRQMLAVDELSNAYAAAWSAGDGAAVDRLYAKSATVTDNLLGVAARGRATGDLATGPPASGALAGMAVVALPHCGGPAVFAAGSTMDHEPMDQVGLILQDAISLCFNTATACTDADCTSWRGDRGVELAAETFGWGLMDTPYQIRRRLPAHSYEELADLFEILTGQRPDPMPPCDDAS